MQGAELRSARALPLAPAPHGKLRRAGIAYVLQDKSIFPDMTMEENSWMGACLLGNPDVGRLFLGG
jgi:ABC-type branched-subunit amino acid transport system ATPase component